MSTQAMNALYAVGLGSIVAVLLLVPTAAVRYRHPSPATLATVGLTWRVICQQFLGKPR